MTERYGDLHDTYASRMVHHGLGMGLFVPISTKDLVPVRKPCCGYFDRNGDWNLITKISHDPRRQREGYTPLVQKPTQITDIKIKWQPKTSQGVSEHAIDTSANTPDNVAGGADAHIKYASSNKFGAVLITKNPVTLHAYHQESLFVRWLDDNRLKLYTDYGPALKKYGMWVVTKTFAAPGCSINAWINSDKQALITMKAKASMLGELGTDLTLEDQIMDKDWSHYDAKSKGEGIVVFVDGIDMTPRDWFWQGLKTYWPSITGTRSRERRPASVEPPMIPKHLDPDTTLLENNEPTAGAHLSVPFNGLPHAISPGLGDTYPIDAGPLHLSRSSSIHRPSSGVSLLSSRPASRTPSLRRETRSVSDTHMNAFKDF